MAKRKVLKDKPKQAQNGGRPKIEVDEVLLEKLAKLHLSDKVISDILGMSEDTLNRRFAEKIETWKSKSKGKIAEVLFDEAVNKREPWAMRLLTQRHLGYTESTVDVTSGGKPIGSTQLSDEDKAILRDIAAKAKNDYR